MSSFKGLITVGRELRQQHPSDLLSGAGTSRRRTTNHEGVVAETPDRPWSIPIITWLNNVILHVFTIKYVQNHHQIERRRLLASIVTSRIFPLRRELQLYTFRREGSECARNIVRHVKLCGQLMQAEWFVAIKIIYVESSITINISETVFVMYKSQV